MAAVSYNVVIGGTLENVLTATNAPGTGQVEIRVDQTATTVNDNGVTRSPKKGEILQALWLLIQYIERDTALNQ